MVSPPFHTKKALGGREGSERSIPTARLRLSALPHVRPRKAERCPSSLSALPPRISECGPDIRDAWIGRWTPAGFSSWFRCHTQAETESAATSLIMFSWMSRTSAMPSNPSVRHLAPRRNLFPKPRIRDLPDWIRDRPTCFFFRRLIPFGRFGWLRLPRFSGACRLPPQRLKSRLSRVFRPAPGPPISGMRRVCAVLAEVYRFPSKCPGLPAPLGAGAQTKTP